MPCPKFAKKLTADLAAQLIRVCQRNILKFTLFGVINLHRLCAGAHTNPLPPFSVPKRLSFPRRLEVKGRFSFRPTLVISLPAVTLQLAIVYKIPVSSGDSNETNHA